MKLPVRVSVITGALGSGKTTTISRLLKYKRQFAPSERWAILVNEFGALGIDGTLLESEAETADPSGKLPGNVSQNPLPGAFVYLASDAGAVVVRELAGGCLCCTLSGPLGVAIAQLVRNAKPDRLLIEPSGLGHPAALVDTLQNEHLRRSLLLQAIICLVDVRLVESTEFTSNQAYQDQINMADILIGTKTDVATSEQVEAFHAFATEVYPPKAQVLTACHGDVDLAVLHVPRLPVYQPMFSMAHSSRRSAASIRSQQAGTQPNAESSAAGQLQTSDAAGTACFPSTDDACREAWAQGKPVRFISESSPEHVACGWLFGQDQLFARGKLQQLCDVLQPAVERVKGVFRVGKEWVSLQLDEVTGRTQLVPIAYRKESRLEVIIRRKAAVGTAKPLHSITGAGLMTSTGTSALMEAAGSSMQGCMAGNGTVALAPGSEHGNALGIHVAHQEGVIDTPLPDMQHLTLQLVNDEAQTLEGASSVTCHADAAGQADWASGILHSLLVQDWELAEERISMHVLVSKP